MSIIRRELTSVTWTHKVTSNYFECFFKVREGRVIAASPQIHWTINHRFDKVRETFSMRGMEIEDLRVKGKSNG